MLNLLQKLLQKYYDAKRIITRYLGFVNKTMEIQGKFYRILRNTMKLFHRTGQKW